MKRVFLILSLLLSIAMLTSNAASAETKLDASILSYDGKDFVRTDTTLMQENGNRRSVQNLTTIVRPTKPWSKSTLTSEPRPFSVKAIKPTTHPSLAQMAN